MSNCRYDKPSDECDGCGYCCEPYTPPKKKLDLTEHPQPELDTMKFSKNFPKLRENQFSTIRIPDGDRWKVGDVINVITPKGSFEAQVTIKETYMLMSIPTHVLIEDTHTEKRKKAVSMLEKSYNKKFKPEDELWYILLTKVDRKTWCRWCGSWVIWEDPHGEVDVYDAMQKHLPHCDSDMARSCRE